MQIHARFMHNPTLLVEAAKYEHDELVYIGVGWKRKRVES